MEVGGCCKKRKRRRDLRRQPAPKEREREVWMPLQRIDANREGKVSSAGIWDDAAENNQQGIRYAHAGTICTE